MNDLFRFVRGHVPTLHTKKKVSYFQNYHEQNIEQQNLRISSEKRVRVCSKMVISFICIQILFVIPKMWVLIYA